SWGKDVAHLWRTTGDISNSFDKPNDHGTWKSWSVMDILDMQDGLREFAGPDHWNDPDMMEVGNGMTAGEDRAHLSMWCMLAAPLIAGNDIRNMTAETKAILLNKDVIAVDQDSLGIQGFKYRSKDSVEIWFKPLAKDDWAMCILNRDGKARKISFNWKEEKVSDAFSNRDAAFDKTVYSLRNLWTKEKAGDTKKALNAEVPSHDVLMLRLIKK
ncbi:MAG TPA: glycoside hydrolase family 27 protein, partial [Ignavibacteriales bacterium]|nr:glycoside hydrolase family 27 protein [Ignavibacteriales bacterium]